MRVDGSYDDAVRDAAAHAAATGGLVVSDTSWDGYEQIPRDIMLGYTRVMDEAAVSMGGHRSPRPAGRAGRRRRTAGRRGQLVGVDLRGRAAAARGRRAAAGGLRAGLGAGRTADDGRRAADHGDGRPALRRGLAAGLRRARAAGRRLSRRRGPLDPRRDASAGARRRAATRRWRSAPRVRPVWPPCSPSTEDPALAGVGAALGLAPTSRVFVIATEGVTEPDLWRGGDRALRTEPVSG